MKNTWPLFFILSGSLISGPLLGQQGMPDKKVLLTKSVTLPANHLVAKVVRIEFPEGFRTPEHIHKGPGPRYVLQGKVKIIDKDGTRIYAPGEVFWETGEPMVAENVADGSTVLLIFEMAPVESGRKKPGKIIIKPH